MKIRNGFVSNSSSSSFIIGVKAGTTIEEIQVLILKYLQVPTTSPLYPYVCQLANELTDFKSNRIAEWIKKFPESYKREIELIKKGYEIHSVTFRVDDICTTTALGPLMLHNNRMEIKTKDLILYKF